MLLRPYGKIWSWRSPQKAGSGVVAVDRFMILGQFPGETWAEPWAQTSASHLAETWPKTGSESMGCPAYVSPNARSNGDDGLITGQEMCEVEPNRFLKGLRYSKVAISFWSLVSIRFLDRIGSNLLDLLDL